MKKFSVSIVVLILLVFSINLGASKVIFGSFPIPLMVVDNNNGVFVELTKAIAKEAGFELEISIKPTKRIGGEFMEGKIDSIFPALDVMFPPGKTLKSSENIYVKQDFVFTKKGLPILKTIKDLAGKNVGITRGYPYAKELMDNKNIKFHVVSKDEMNTKKLIAGRIDAFVVEEKSGLKAFANAKLDGKFQYDKAVPLSKQDVYYAFQKNEKGKKLEATFSAALKKIKENGTFGKIMSKAK